MTYKKPCIRRDCYEVSLQRGRCLKHYKEDEETNFSHSTRKKRLPKDWRTRTKHVMKRDKGICYLCGRKAEQVDHIKPGDDHSFKNLAAICEDCHRKKTAKEYKVLPESLSMIGQKQYKRYMREKHTPYLPEIDPLWEYKMDPPPDQ